MSRDYDAINAARRKYQANVERDRISAEASAATQIQQQTGATRTEALATARRMLDSEPAHTSVVDPVARVGAGVSFYDLIESIESGDEVADTPRA